MLLSKIVQILTITGLTYAHIVPQKASTNLAIRQDLNDLDALERAANSLLPDIPLPTTINDATTTLLQLMTIWFESEISAYHETIALISNNSKGYTDLRRWNKSEVLDILSTNLAESSLQFNYTVSLLTHYSVPLIPGPCTYKAPLVGIALSRDMIYFQELNTLLIDSMQDYSNHLTFELTPILWSIATSKAEQNGFYNIFDNYIPSERAFMTSVPPELAFSTFAQQLRKCPFELEAITPISAPLFEDWIIVGESFTYCANLSHVPSDPSNLYLSIIAGTQMPIIVPATNITFNGTIIEFDSDYPRKQGILEGLVMVALIEATDATTEEKTADWVGDRTLASAFIQVQQPLDGDAATPDDIICPRSGGTLFWDFISP
ncbi:hypothetical protein DE146DRAFT_136093 [Phaeosphaeria sp. MPI-PUGE-AT-0046c]|nr:hypothetical protein DE146DRAFT_136093 [Phaeosphaeria sp. MPI-PUGE-AT-0046c]